MKPTLTSLAAIAVLGVSAGCILSIPEPIHVGAGQGTSALTSPPPTSVAETASGLPPQKSHLPRERIRSSRSLRATEPLAGPQPMSPVQTLKPQTLDRPDLSLAEAQANISTINIAVQQTLRVDYSPLSSSVQVGQQGGNIVLSGSVPDEATRIQVEQAARGSTTGGFIDNQIRVEPR